MRTSSPAEIDWSRESPPRALRARLVEAAASYCRGPRFPKGTRFVHHGRTPGVGLDCGGLVVCAGQEAGGVYVRDTLDYPAQPWSRRMKEYLRGCARELPGGLDEAGAGSIVLFFAQDHPKIQIHLGILDGEGGVVHAWHKVGFVSRSPMEYWTRYVDSVYDFWPLESVPLALEHGLLHP